MDNPLLEDLPLPPFDRILPEHVAPAVDHCLAAFRETLDRLADVETPTWDSFMAVEEALAERLERAWAPVSHLHSVSDVEAWRRAYSENVVKLSAFFAELGQDARRYRAYRAVRDGDEYGRLDRAQRKVIDDALRDFHLSGIDLDPEDQTRFRQIRNELTELATRFQQNLQDATDAWSLTFDGPEALAGLPDGELEAARARASERGEAGWTVTLEYPSYHAVMTYAEERTLRERVYRAYATRASDQGEGDAALDNAPLIHRILTLRGELARLLGYRHYADVSLATKMVETPEEALDFLHGLAARARPKAAAELEELRRFAVGEGGPEDLQAWDVAFWSERLRKARYAISDEEIRPYFSAEHAVAGLFAVAGELFEVEFRPRSDVSTWHPSVDYFDVVDGDGKVIAGFYVDLFARRAKRGGAWMADCRSRARTEQGIQLPVAFLNCNFPPPTDHRPSLLNHNELTTLFHEFGHALHHMLTRIDYPTLAGINGVEWDAVELPSQFLENWCWQRPALDRFARHFETGDRLPADLFQRMEAARTFQSGLFLVRQLEFGISDLRMHWEFDPHVPDHAERILEAVRDEVAVLKPPAWNRFLSGFSHLFAGGYAAGYYSYLWAEQLAADAFDRFAQEGVFSRELGHAFRAEVLEVGGSRPARESFVAFRGREPDLRPLLRHYGIDAQAA